MVMRPEPPRDMESDRCPEGKARLGGCVGLIEEGSSGSKMEESDAIRSKAVEDQEGV